MVADHRYKAREGELLKRTARIAGCAGLLLLATIFLSVSVLPVPSYAASFRILDQGAAAAGQSDAFTAQADDPSAIYYNPAGMTQLPGVQTYIGTTLIGGSTSFTSPAGVNARGDFGGSVAYPPPSNLYVTANLRDLGATSPWLSRMALGVGLNFPFGTKFRWPENGPFATAVTTAALQLLDIKPTIAYKVTDRFSIGLGMDIYTFSSLIGEGHYETRLIGSPGLGPLAGASLEINGRDTALGFNASFLYTPCVNADGKPICSIGFVYRSQATLHLDGQFRANGGLVSDASTTLVLPQVFTGGIALWPVRDREREWKLEFDVDYTGWKSIRNLDVHTTSPFGTIPFPQNYRSGYTVMIGTEYKWLHPERLPNWEIALRGGYWNSQAPSPDSSFNPAIQDADNHSISVGLGFLCKGGGRFLGLFECGRADGGSKFRPTAVGLDLAYKALLYETRTVTGNQNP
ncbi:MAG TPA: outer membrane protein transport protein, partial [Nitrospiraceae bacterium]|nr:outer membrane protein transport protein [Nitrospiraceae bacterium]